MPTARQVTLIVWLIGALVVVALTVWFGAGLVGQAIVSAGWATAIVVVVRAVSAAGAGVGWWFLFPRELRPSLWLCTLLRFVREGANALLPLAQIGGDFIGARCLAMRGTRGAVAAASVIVDVQVQAATQLAFAAVGLVLLLAAGGHDLVVWPAAIGIALAIPALGAFFLAQGRLGHGAAIWLLALLAGGRAWRAFGAIDELFAQLEAFYRNRRGLLHGGLWHFADWFIGAIEVWVVLHFMGYPITFEQAVIVESLMHAVRGAAFAVPGALGAQEGGLVVLCAMFGVPPEAAIALSLVKRIPDLVIGLPGLMAWQAMEGWRFRLERGTGRGQNERT
jgi:putative membrane protein